jgi:hypothetical protein
MEDRRRKTEDGRQKVFRLSPSVFRHMTEKQARTTATVLMVAAEARGEGG